MLYKLCSHFLVSSTFSFLLASRLCSQHAQASPTENKKVLLTHDPFSFSSLPWVLRVDLNFSLSFVPQPPAVWWFRWQDYFVNPISPSTTLSSLCTFPVPLILLTVLSFNPLIFHTPLFCSHIPVWQFVLLFFMGSFFHLPFLGNYIYTHGFTYHPCADHSSTACLVLTSPLYLTLTS